MIIKAVIRKIIKSTFFIALVTDAVGVVIYALFHLFKNIGVKLFEIFQNTSNIKIMCVALVFIVIIICVCIVICAKIKANTLRIKYHEERTAKMIKEKEKTRRRRELIKYYETTDIYTIHSASSFGRFNPHRYNSKKHYLKPINNKHIAQ